MLYRRFDSFELLFAMKLVVLVSETGKALSNRLYDKCEGTRY